MSDGPARIDDTAARAHAPSFRDDVLAGLARPRKALPAKYFYDARGSELFEAITRLPAYYPTRTELRILADHAVDLGRHVPPGAALVEFGSGSTAKLRALLPGLPDLSAYVPVDVSAEFLAAEARRLAADHPALAVAPVVADFARAFTLPPVVSGRPTAGFFPGSTIGNFEPGEAASLLRHFATLLGAGATLIAGVDLVKDDATLELAYDDPEGVTAAFNLNLLVRINRELGGDFDLAGFRHRAFFDRALGRIEMHLVSRDAQAVTIADTRFGFAAGETIHTENSYKYTPEGFGALAETAGWQTVQVFVDPDHLFSVFVLTAR